MRRVCVWRLRRRRYQARSTKTEKEAKETERGREKKLTTTLQIAIQMAFTHLYFHLGIRYWLICSSANNISAQAVRSQSASQVSQPSSINNAKQQLHAVEILRFFFLLIHRDVVCGAFLNLLMKIIINDDRTSERTIFNSGNARPRTHIRRIFLFRLMSLKRKHTAARRIFRSPLNDHKSWQVLSAGKLLVVTVQWLHQINQFHFTHGAREREGLELEMRCLWAHPNGKWPMDIERAQEPSKHWIQMWSADCGHAPQTTHASFPSILLRDSMLNSNSEFRYSAVALINCWSRCGPLLFEFHLIPKVIVAHRTQLSRALCHFVVRQLP